MNVAAADALFAIFGLKRKPMSPILTIDAGFRSCGWAVLNNGAVADTGCIRTKPSDKKRNVRKADDDIEACSLLTRELCAVIRVYGVKGIICEMPTAGAQGARANRCMGMATAVVASVVEVSALPAEWVTPEAVKLVAHAGASKADVEAAVRKRWPGLLLPDVLAEREHIADALGAYMAAEHGQLVRMLGAA